MVREVFAISATILVVTCFCTALDNPKPRAEGDLHRCAPRGQAL